MTFLKWERKSLASSSISPLYLIFGVLLVMLLGKMDKHILYHLQGIRKPEGSRNRILILNQIIFLSITLCAIFFPLFSSLSKTIYGYSRIGINHAMGNQVN